MPLHTIQGMSCLWPQHSKPALRCRRMQGCCTLLPSAAASATFDVLPMKHSLARFPRSAPAGKKAFHKMCVTVDRSLPLSQSPGWLGHHRASSPQPSMRMWAFFSCHGRRAWQSRPWPLRRGRFSTLGSCQRHDFVSNRFLLPSPAGSPERVRKERSLPYLSASAPPASRPS